MRYELATSKAGEALKEGEGGITALEFQESSMKTLCRLALVLVGFSAFSVSAATFYVALDSPNPTQPYTNWETAARVIQEAVDAAKPGDTVLVTNGVYQTGGTGDTQVQVRKPLALRSVNGPGVTVIDGGGRCAYLANGASLSGFTLTKGRAESGGGVYAESEADVITNCVLTGNSAGFGGGAYGGTLNNCTLTGNSFVGWGPCSCAGSGGGAAGGTLNNCIVYDNRGPWSENYANATLNYCCTTPMPTNGVGNITNAPLFLDSAGGNFRLQANSPCINAGNNAYTTNTTDLDGRPRIVGGTVDFGAYEFQPGISNAFIAWLRQYGLPTDGSADATDADADGLDNRQEWRCLTDPTNALSVLRLLALEFSGNNVAVRWQSLAGVNYSLERSTDLAAIPRFMPLAMNLPGQSNTTSYTDTNAAQLSPLFYRVGVGQ